VNDVNVASPCILGPDCSSAPRTGDVSIHRAVVIVVRQLTNYRSQPQPTQESGRRGSWRQRRSAALPKIDRRRNSSSSSAAAATALAYRRNPTSVKCQGRTTPAKTDLVFVAVELRRISIFTVINVQNRSLYASLHIKNSKYKNVILRSMTSPKCQCTAEQYHLFDICCC